MLTKLLTYKTGIVMAFTIAISSVYVCQVLCDFDIYSMKRACHTTVNSVANQAGSDHKDSHSSSGHHHDSDKEQDHHDQTSRHSENHANHHSGNDEDCCDDMTNNVFESLFTQKVNIPSLEVKLFFVFKIEFPLYQVSFNNICTNSFNYYSDSSPPTKGGSIMVLVQSFLL